MRLLRTALFVLGSTVALAQTFNITTGSLPNGTAGIGYSATVTATGCPFFSQYPQGNLYFDISGLPSGLSANSSGDIFGIPAEAGTFSVSITAYCGNYDGNGVRTATVRLFIADALRITTTSLPGASVGVPYLQTITAAGGKPPYVFSAAGLPPGLSIDAAGNITGSPTAGGVYGTIFKVTDSLQDTSLRPINISVIVPLSIVTASPLPPGTIGVNYSQFITAVGGSPVYIFRVAPGSTLPPGLTLGGQGGLNGVPTTNGTFTFTVQATDSVNTVVTKAFSLTVGAVASPLTLTPNFLRFQTRAGADNPSPQNLTVTSANAATAFTVTVDDTRGGPAPAWIRVSPTAGTTPGGLRVSAISEGLSPNTYLARIRAKSATSTSFDDITVTLEVFQPAPALSVEPSILPLRAKSATPGPVEGTFVIRSTGGGNAVPVQMAIVNNSSWITRIEPTSGRVLPNAPVVVKVFANNSGLVSRGYRDAIRITSSLGNLEVPVVLTVQPSGPVMTLSQNGLRFFERQGPASPDTLNVTVLNIGDQATPVVWRARILRGADVITLSTNQGSTPTTALLTVGLTPGTTSTPGAKNAIIEVTQQGFEASPQYVMVQVDVAASTAAPSLVASPSGMLFIGDALGAAPASQTLTVKTSSSTGVPFSASAVADDGGTWLSAAPAAASTSLTQSGIVTVSVNQRGLAAGFYTGQVNVQLGTSVRSMNVGFLVRPQPGIAEPEAPLAAPRERSATCTPAQVNVVQLGSTNNYVAAAGWPVNLSVAVLDNCGTPLPDASVVASFSNGDAPLPLVSDGVSRFSATWQPRTAGNQVTARVDATLSSLASGQSIITGTVDANALPAPILAPGGVLNNLNATVGAPLAPGTVVAVFGDNLAAATTSATALPLPTNLGGVELIIGGFSSPLYFVSKGQLTAQLPTELAADKPYSALVITDNRPSVPQILNLVSVTPGTVAFPDGRLVAQHADFSLVDAARPAKPNEALTIYLVGMGATNPAVASGAVAPSNPLARVTSNVELTVDGQTAELFFAGLTPGGIGLYQINFRVPPTARAGSLDVVISQDGAKANPSKLVVVQ